MSRSPGHETRDVRVGSAVLAMAGLALAAACAVAAMVWLAGLFAAGQRAALPRLTPQQTVRLAPPPPNLQPDPLGDLARERVDAAGRLAGYAYLDDAHTRARIPIARAMRLSIGRPLDPPAAPPPEGAAR